MMKQWLVRWRRMDRLEAELSAMRARLAETELGDRLSAVHAAATESAVRAAANAEAIGALADRIGALESAEDEAQQGLKTLSGEFLSLERQFRLGERQAAEASRALLERIDEMRRYAAPIIPDVSQ